MHDRTMYLQTDSTHFYMGTVAGDDLDLYECWVGRSPVMIHSCQCHETDPSGINVIMRHLPIAHIPPLAVHSNPEIKEAAMARLADKRRRR
jgi:hypothetical protein